MDEKSAEHLTVINVTDEFIDRNGHVNNVVYVRWMQDAAVAHSKAVLPDQIYKRTGGTWVARSHHIEYLQQAFEGDTLELKTWLAGLRRVRCKRKYKFRRKADGKVVARGESNWVFINKESGRPMTIPEEIEERFVIHGDG